MIKINRLKLLSYADAYTVQLIVAAAIEVSGITLGLS